MTIRKITFGTMGATGFALCTGRISIAVSLLILMGTNNTRKWFLWFLIVQQIIITIITNSITMFYCQPVAKFWDQSIPGKCIDAKIRKGAAYPSLSEYLITPQSLILTCSVSGIVTDLALTLMPILIISSLNLKLRLKLGLVALMSLGML